MSDVPDRPDASDLTRGTTHRRVFRTIIVSVNAAFLLLWIAGGFIRGMRGCGYLAGNDKLLCESHNGGPPAATVILLWVATDVIVLALWRWRRRTAGRFER
jgi:hypothetical protein